MADPISNPGIPPTPATPSLPGGKPFPGENPEGQKPFALPPDPAQQPTTGGAVEGKPTPMEIMKDKPQQNQWTAEEMQDHLQKVQNQLQGASDKLNNPAVRQNLTPTHEQGLKKLTDKLNPDLKKIASGTESSFNPPALKKGEGILDHVARWVDGAQGTLAGAAQYMQGGHKMGLGDYLKLQYAVQRASQRSELFASIIGSTVSGVKTIMSTQLG